MSPAAARLSASVILVRDAAAGLETFMVRRHARSSVAPSAYVFPGGTVRPDDAWLLAADGRHLADKLSERADDPVEDSAACALYTCALRELFEEAGVLLVRDRGGHVLAIEANDRVLRERLATMRLAVQAAQVALAAALEQFGFEPDFERLVPFSHWVTPEPLATRFDTRFFVADMPPGQAALHCTIETTEGVWLAPARMLDGDYQVVYPTAQHLRRLAAFQQVGDLLEFASSKPIRRVQPSLIDSQAGPTPWLDPVLVDRW